MKLKNLIAAVYCIACVGADVGAVRRGAKVNTTAAGSGSIVIDGVGTKLAAQDCARIEELMKLCGNAYEDTVKALRGWNKNLKNKKVSSVPPIKVNILARLDDKDNKVVTIEGASQSSNVDLREPKNIEEALYIYNSALLARKVIDSKIYSETKAGGPAVVPRSMMLGSGCKALAAYAAAVAGPQKKKMSEEDLCLLGEVIVYVNLNETERVKIAEADIARDKKAKEAKEEKDAAEVAKQQALETKLVTKEEDIQKLQEQLKESQGELQKLPKKDELITKSTQEIEKLKADLLEKDKSIAERDQVIKELTQKSLEKDGLIAKRDQEIEGLNVSLVRRAESNELVKELLQQTTQVAQDLASEIHKTSLHWEVAEIANEGVSFPKKKLKEVRKQVEEVKTAADKHLKETQGKVSQAVDQLESMLKTTKGVVENNVSAFNGDAAITAKRIRDNITQFKNSIDAIKNTPFDINDGVQKATLRQLLVRHLEEMIAGEYSDILEKVRMYARTKNKLQDVEQMMQKELNLDERTPSKETSHQIRQIFNWAQEGLYIKKDTEKNLTP